MRAQFLHLSGPFRGQTVNYDEHRVLIGTSAEAGLRYPSGVNVLERHALLTFVPEGCSFYLKALDGEVFVNRWQIEEVILEMGDLVEFGVGGPKARFRICTQVGDVCKPVRQMLGDAMAVGQQSGMVASGQALAGDMVFRSTRSFKAASFIVVIAFALLGSYIGGVAGGKRVAKEQERAGARLEELHQQDLDRLREQLAEFRHLQAGQVTREEVAALRSDLESRAKVVDSLVARNQSLRRVLDEYSRGVCLIHGIYTFYGEADGVPVQLHQPDGSPLLVEYLGSGFRATADGMVLTNRHVMQPWWNNEVVAPLLMQGLAPRFVSITATFPGEMPKAVDPETIRISADDVDVARFRVDGLPETVPVLPRYEGELSAMRGSRVVVLGYPTGLNAVLARSEPSLVEEALSEASDTASLIEALARRKAVSPVITQGSLNEVRPRRLVYDAETTSGGSGGPVFGVNGLVIGVNFAITRDFDGSNYGVPIGFAAPLLDPALPPTMTEKSEQVGE